MSASTVSVTANPTVSTRRRPVPGDVKATVDILSDSPAKDDPNNNNSNKDLSHSIRGEAILEQKPSKKPQFQSTQIRTRTRKNPSSSTTPTPPKPRWVTIMSVLAKNLLLLIVLVGLVQMVRRLIVSSSGSVGEGGLIGYSEMEGRIAQVESSLKTATKMLQVQVEVVDKKVEGLVSDVRREVSRRLEDKSVEVDTRLRELDERSAGLEAALRELNSKDLLSKEDLGKLYDEFKKGKGAGTGWGGEELGLDEVRALAREIVKNEIEKHASDGLGRADYALSSGGGMIVKHSERLVVGKMGSWFGGNSRNGVDTDADKMLKPSFGEPGQCFPLKGSSGFVEIRLRTAIVPEAITLEHVAKSVAYDRSSAPKHCRVSGWLQGWQGQQGLDTEFAVDSEKMLLLTEFTYDLEKSNAQTVNVLDLASSAVIDTVRFEFSSNHGSPSHTCIYRLRVHGHEPNSIQMIAADP